MEILILLPLTFLGSLSIIISRISLCDPAKTIIASLTIFSLFVHMVTELQSATSLLTQTGSILLWILAIIFLIPVSLLVTRLNPKTAARQNITLTNSRKYKIQDKILGIIIVLVLTGTFTSAILGTPNTCDALVYHIPRILHWTENGDVSFYSTHIQRQITHPPLLEYCFLQIWLLTGSDRFFNLVQWGSFVGCLALSVSFARAINASTTGIRLSLLYTATLPIAVMQASSPKNDLFFAFHMCAFAYFLMLTIKEFSWSYALMATASLGLSVSSKGTAFLFAPAIGLPLGIYWLYVSISKKDFLKKFAILASIALCAVILASPHLGRSLKHYDTISSAGSDNLTNEDYSSSALLGNIVRMAAANLAVPVPILNQPLQYTLEKLTGEELNNKSNIYLGDSGRKFKLDAAPTETKMSNPLHMLGFLLAAPYLLMRKRESAHSRIIAGCAVACFLVFALIIRWSDWITRYHLTFLLLAAPLVGSTLGRGRPLSYSNPKYLVCILVSLIALACSFLNVYRPVFPFRHLSVLTTPRYEQYFMYDNSSRKAQLERKSSMERVVNACLERIAPASNRKTIGLICSSSSTEYLLWKTASEQSQSLVAFQHVYVDNQTKDFRKHESPPQTIIIEKNTDPNLLKRVENDGYRSISIENEWIAYAKN